MFGFDTAIVQERSPHISTIVVFARYGYDVTKTLTDKRLGVIVTGANCNEHLYFRVGSVPS